MVRTSVLFDPDARPTASGRFVVGFRAAFAGMPVVFADRRLLLLSVVPMLLHMGLFIALLFVFVGHGAPAAGDAIGAVLGLDAKDGSAWTMVLTGIVRAGAVLLGIVVAFFGSVFGASVLGDPFYDLLSERAEELSLGRAVGAPLTLRSVGVGLARELSANIVRIVLWAMGALPLWLLSFTVAAIVAGPLSLLWTWLFTAYEFLSRSLVRHTVDIGGRFGALFSHKALFLGFGAGATLLSLVPFTSPFLVVGATRLYLALAARDQVASRLSDEDRRRLGIDSSLQEKAP